MQQDIERVIAVSRATPASVSLRLDVNQGWTAKQSIYALSKIKQAAVELELVELELVEQPVKAQDLAGLKAVTAAVHTPVMADESAFSPQQVIQLQEQQAAVIINIKLMKTGGISKALLTAQIAGLYKVPCMMGFMRNSSEIFTVSKQLRCISLIHNYFNIGLTLACRRLNSGGTVFIAHIG